MAYDKQKEDFTEARASLVSYSDVPRMHSRQLVREWKTVTDKEKATNLFYLNAFISAKNAAASRTILDPQADGAGTLEGGAPKNQFTGLWRHVSTSWSAERNSYLQMLRYGYAATLAWDEALLTGGSGETATDRMIRVRWNNIDPSYLDDIVRALNAGTLAGILATGLATDPNIGGDVYAGSWAVGNVAPSWGEDGSGVIEIDFYRAYAVANKEALAALSPKREVFREVTHPFGRAGGYVGPLERSYTRMIRLTYEHILPGSTAALEAMTGTQLQPILGGTWSFVSSAVTPDGKGCLQFQIVGRLVSRRAWPGPVTADLTQFTSMNAGARDTIRQMWYSYRNAEHEVIMTYLRGASDIPNFYVAAVVPTDNDDGSTDYTRTLVNTAESSRPEVEPKFCMEAAGREIERRQHPYGKTQDQIRYHYLTRERLYTNNQALAEAWAAYAPISTSPKGNTGSKPAWAGWWKEREKGSTRYVSYRVIEDYCTAWEEAPKTPMSPAAW